MTWGTSTEGPTDPIPNHGWRLRRSRDVLNATGGGGGGAWGSGEAPSQGARPFAVAQGVSQSTFWVGWISWTIVRGQSCLVLSSRRKMAKTAENHKNAAARKCMFFHVFLLVH